MIIFPAFDYRFHWSDVPPYLVILGDMLVGLGLYIVFLVFVENSFASGIIELAPNQKVITTGPYAHVRHPMYTGALIMLFGVPFALGSWWDLYILLIVILGFSWRLSEEEKFLAKNLPGYADYRQRVRYRLLPGFW
jgi:protein-S-isoprenylcysteine O-methyltransferase Ste14